MKLIGKKHIIKHHEDSEEHQIIYKYRKNILSSIKIEDIVPETTVLRSSPENPDASSGIDPSKVDVDKRELMSSVLD